MDANTKPDFCTDEELEDYLIELDSIRAGGQYNMYGAAEPLRELNTNLTKQQARAILLYWMATFSDRQEDANA